MIEQMAASDQPEHRKRQGHRHHGRVRLAKEAAVGGATVKETVDAMNSIAGKIGIIDDIAYSRTNLLALNAATGARRTEAACAGEHGKGWPWSPPKCANWRNAARSRRRRSASSRHRVRDDGREGRPSCLMKRYPTSRRLPTCVQEIAGASQEQSAGCRPDQRCHGSAEQGHATKCRQRLRRARGHRRRDGRPGRRNCRS